MWLLQQEFSALMETLERFAAFYSDCKFQQQYYSIAEVCTTLSVIDIYKRRCREHHASQTATRIFYVMEPFVSVLIE